MCAAHPTGRAGRRTSRQESRSTGPVSRCRRARPRPCASLRPGREGRRPPEETMRLSEWVERAPHQASMAPKVLATVTPILLALGASEDPQSWIAWGDDPAARYVILTPTPAGLVQVHVRVNVPQEGPRS